MTEDETRTPPPIANAIRRLLRRHGLSERAMSERVGRGKTWLSDALRRHPLTFEGAEDIAAEFGLTLPDLIAEAYPKPADPTASPHALLANLTPERETEPLPPFLRDDLEAFLAHSPNVRNVVPPSYEVLRSSQSYIWTNRSRVIEYTLFQLNESLKPRQIHTFIGMLAIFSDILRVCESVDLFHRCRLMLRAHELLEAHPHPGISALLIEKTAYLCWDLTSDAAITTGILEHPASISHPFPDHLFACRAWFYMLHERSEPALAYANIVFSMRSSPISIASAHSTTANVYANQGNPATGVPYLIDALDIPDLPEHLRINLEAEAARLQVLIGEVDHALDTFYQIIQNAAYCDLWPLKAGFVALDFLKADPPERLLQKALPRLLKIQANLKPKQKTEAAVLRSLAPYLSAATATSTMALQKKGFDPNR